VADRAKRTTHFCYTLWMKKLLVPTMKGEVKKTINFLLNSNISTEHETSNGITHELISTGLKVILQTYGLFFQFISRRFLKCKSYMFKRATIVRHECGTEWS